MWPASKWQWLREQRFKRRPGTVRSGTLNSDVIHFHGTHVPIRSPADASAARTTQAVHGADQCLQDRRADTLELQHLLEAACRGSRKAFQKPHPLRLKLLICHQLHNVCCATTRATRQLPRGWLLTAGTASRRLRAIGKHTLLSQAWAMQNPLLVPQRQQQVSSDDVNPQRLVVVERLRAEPFRHPCLHLRDLVHCKRKNVSNKGVDPRL